MTFHGGPVDEQSEEITVYADGILTGKNDQMILSFCYIKERETKEIAAKIGISPSSYFRNNVLKRLVDEGYLLSFKRGKRMTYLANQRKVHV